jgi:imidazoleglycerol-phosphate dehydratase
LARTAEIKRNTSETEVSVSIDLDGSGKSSINTGIAFVDHMLSLFAKHGLFDLNVECRGDLQIDSHHTVEDTAITFGQTFLKALGDKRGIVRYGVSYVPMDETLVRAVCDLSGRAYLVYHVTNTRDKIGNFDVEMAEHFWHSFAEAARCNLHIELLYGRNQHHILEGIWKACSKALSQAVQVNERITGVLSTKGTL